MKSWLAAEQQALIRQIKQQTLPHAMIVSGVAGAGKDELSHWLAQALMCQSELSSSAQTGLLIEESTYERPCGQCKSCNLFQQQTHPDSMLVELLGASIGVDQIRKVSRFFEKTAQLGTNQVVIIQDADKMTESAANALLKTLEEPTEHSFIILLVNDEQRLIPTIISRCRHIQLKPPIGEQLLSQIGQESRDPFVNLSHLPELSDPVILEKYQEISAQFVEFIYQSNNRLALTELLKTQDNSLRWLEKTVIDLMRSHYHWRDADLLKELNTQQFAVFMSANQDKLWKIYQLINSFNKKKVTLMQFNKEFGLEKLLIDIQMMMAA